MQAEVASGNDLPTMKDNKDIFLRLSFDALYEICCCLAPEDLLILSRTSKAMRSAFTSKHSASWWIAARRNIKCPEPLEGYSEPLWAALLCVDTCLECGKDGSTSFDLMVRMCDTCFRKQSINTRDITKTYPSECKSIFDGVLACDRLSTGDLNMRLRTDVDDFVARLKGIKGKISKKTKQLKADLMKERKEYLKKVKSNVGTYKAWIVTRAHEKDLERRLRRRMQVINCYRTLGYDREDIEYVITTDSYSVPMCKPVEYSPNEWPDFDKHYTRLIQDHAYDRKENLKAKLIDERNHLFAPYYNIYLSTLLPHQREYQPSLIDICNSYYISNILCSDPEKPVDQFEIKDEWVQEIMMYLPGIIHEWLKIKQEFLIFKLREGLLNNALYSADEQSVWMTIICNSLDNDPSGLQLIRLAVAVLSCPSYSECTGTTNQAQPVIGWDEVGRHKCFFQDHGRGEYNGAVRDIRVDVARARDARILIQLAGLEPEFATPLDMDRRGMRVICLQCQPAFHLSSMIRGKRAYSWRSAIAHATSTDAPRWKVLSESEVKQLQSEGDEPATLESCWTCSHCPYFVDKWGTKDEVISHLSSAHEISGPEMQIDYFIYRSMTNSKERDFIFPS